MAATKVRRRKRRRRQFRGLRVTRRDLTAPGPCSKRWAAPTTCSTTRTFLGTTSVCLRELRASVGTASVGRRTSETSLFRRRIHCPELDRLPPDQSGLGQSGLNVILKLFPSLLTLLHYRPILMFEGKAIVLLIYP
jgi:hypothetical protein